MRALTLHQPWADLIIWGGKDVENRSWSPPSTVTNCARGCDPFRLGIHAGKRVANVPRWVQIEYDKVFDHLIDADSRLGVLLGFVTVTGFHHADDCGQVGHDHYGYGCSRWAEPDVYHWELADPEPLDERVPMRGYQGLWTIPEDALP